MAELMPYGIHDEQTDMRAHVCVVVRRIYVYATKAANELLTNRVYPTASAFQGELQTATGYLVPPKDIPGCRQIEPPEVYWSLYPITSTMSTTEKGDKAAHIVELALKSGLIALPAQPRLIEDMDLQIKGVDIIASIHARIQVKCDFNGGPKSLGGTGNLFLQIAEANPYKRH